MDLWPEAYWLGRHGDLGEWVNSEGRRKECLLGVLKWNYDEDLGVATRKIYTHSTVCGLIPCVMFMHTQHKGKGTVY